MVVVVGLVIIIVVVVVVGLVVVVVVEVVVVVVVRLTSAMSLFNFDMMIIKKERAMASYTYPTSRYSHISKYGHICKVVKKKYPHLI